MVVSPTETSVIRPIAPSDVGRLKMPTPTILPTTSAVAPARVRRPPSVAVARRSAPGAVVAVEVCT
jgi:hypothetical protein